MDINNHNKLSYSKDGNYLIWDVNTSTMIANIDEYSNLQWKKLVIPNSIYARYQRYDSLTLNNDSNTKPNYVNSNLLIPYMSAMANLPNYLILGSVNGDLHIVHASCLEYDRMSETNPKDRELFVAKTYNAHCSQVGHIEFNQERSLVYTSGLTDRCVFKWRIEGDFSLDALQAGGSQGYTEPVSNTANTGLSKNLPLYSQLNYYSSATIPIT